MTQYPLTALKRKLEDENTPLPKRLRLAKNVVSSQYFPIGPKARIIGDWLDSLTNHKKLTSKELKDILSWLNNTDTLTVELLTKLIKVVSQYLHNVPLRNDDIQYIISFIENTIISVQLNNEIDDFLFITINLLQHLHNNEHNSTEQWVKKIFNILIKYYKESKKKLEFVVKFLDGEVIETIFNYLHTDYHEIVINLCGNILFPIAKKTIFSSFLVNLIRRDNVEELIAEKGENIQLVIKVMTCFFTFPKGRTVKDQKFLLDFIEVFVASFKNDSQLVFAFYIMVISFLNLNQNYISPAMNMPPVIFENGDEKMKRNIFLYMLEVLLKNDIDISVKFTDTLGQRISTAEVKKNFMTFLQAVTMGILKLDGKIDKTSLKIIKAGLKLDPSLIEQKIDQILPYIMTTKKTSHTITTYIDTINYLLETLFKLSRGVDFINKIIPHIKLTLEAFNVEQFELKQKMNESINSESCDKLNNKIINGNDIMPPDCVEVYGKFTSELMFRQNKDLLLSLQKELENNCLLMLEEGFVSPSIITLTEVLSSILCSFFRHTKMADHTVPLNIAEEFWTVYQKFEDECLKKFGECILKLNYNPPLVVSFLNLCLSFSQLKILNIKYANTKVTLCEIPDTLNVNDMSVILPCLNSQQWITLASDIQTEAILLWHQLLLTKIIAVKVISKSKENELENTTKTHLIKQITTNPELLESNHCYTKEMFTNLDKHQSKNMAKILIKRYIDKPEFFETISYDKYLLQALVVETVKILSKSIDNLHLKKPLNRYINDVSCLGKENDILQTIENIKIEEDLMNSIEILKRLQIQHLDEGYQLITILTLLMVKKCCPSKKHKRIIDNVLQIIFELSAKYPDIYKLFPVDAIFDFDKNVIMDLLILRNKTSNNFIIKCILESAVKRVKTDPEIVKNIVKILLKNQKVSRGSIESFNNEVFQISCIILPLIAKEKRAITTSAFRSILANMQEKLNKAMLKSFKNIDFDQINSKSDDNETSTLNAISAYTLTLLKCCETTDIEEIQSLDCLWSGLEYFVNKSIKAIESPNSKIQHVQSSLQLLNVTLRYIKKLESHPIFQNKDKLFQKIWSSIKTRLVSVYSEKNTNNILEEIGITLKFLAELSSIECFGNSFVGDLSTLAVLKKPVVMLKNDDAINLEISSRKVLKYLCIQCLRANIIAPKCIAITKLTFRTIKNFRYWIQQHYVEEIGGKDGGQVDDEKINIVKIDDNICELIRNDLDIMAEVILAAKKVTLDYKYLDAIFELLHLVHYVMGRKTWGVKCEIQWRSFFTLFEGYIGVLNNMLLSREELIEDRWPCYIQCYKTLIQCICERSAAQDTLDVDVEHKLAESGHSIEKLTQAIRKRKAHVSRIAAYAVADVCAWIERSPPPKVLRQHLENSIALLIQASDSTYSVAFLRRALAGSIGQMTMTNMYTMYKRYHKYVGNS